MFARVSADLSVMLSAAFQGYDKECFTMSSLILTLFLLLGLYTVDCERQRHLVQDEGIVAEGVTYTAIGIEN
jgi:hypothetical protein